MNTAGLVSIVVTFIFVINKNLWTQNLVPNPGFEEYNECPKNYTGYSEKLKISNWYSPTKGTPDYFNSCSKFNVSVPVNFMGNVFAKEGNAYIGLLLAEKPEIPFEKKKPYNQREYVQVKLLKPLLGGNNYSVSCFYCVAPHSGYALNRLGIALTTKPEKKRNKVIPLKYLVSIDTSRIDTISGVWFKLAGTIRAKGGEQYLTIGNFNDDFTIKYRAMDYSEYRKSIQQAIKQNGYSYYFIDMVSVMPLNE